MFLVFTKFGEEGSVRLRFVRDGVCRVHKRGIVLSQSLTRLCNVRAGHLGRTIEEGLEHFPISFVFRLGQGRFRFLESRVTSSGKQNKLECVPFTFARRKMTVLSSILGDSMTVRIGVSVVHTFITMHRLVSGPPIGSLTGLRSRVRRLGKCVRRIFTNCGSVGSSAHVRVRLVGQALTRLRAGRGSTDGPHGPVNFGACGGWVL